MTDLSLYREALDATPTLGDAEAVLATIVEQLEWDWEAWAHHLFPEHTTYGFAAHHRQLWDWAWEVQDGERTEPFVGVWARGGAKSTTAELVTVAMGARRRRRYVLYVCGTQTQADDHVANIGRLLESERFAALYPALGRPDVGEYGKSWRRNRLSTGAGFTIDAVGLDTAMRGVRIDADRPDLLVLDDLDSVDSPKVTQRRIDQLTRSLMPTMAGHGTILAVQNLVIPNGIFARMVGVAEAGDSDLLLTATKSGPIPAVRDLVLEQRPDPDPALDGKLRWYVKSGEPSWEGQGIAMAEAQIADRGKTAFLIEAQHEVHRLQGGIFSAWEWMEDNWVDHPYTAVAPSIKRIRVWDTAGTEETGDNDPDWTAGVKLAVDTETGRFRIEDLIRFRHASGTRANLIRATADADAELHGLEGCDIGVEQRPGPDGRDEVREYMLDVLAGFTVRKLDPFGSKTERAEPWAAAMENQLVTMVRADWNTAFLAEHEGFPNGAHDDQVDACAHAYRWLRKFLLTSGGGVSTDVAASHAPLRR